MKRATAILTVLLLGPALCLSCGDDDATGPPHRDAGADTSTGTDTGRSDVSGDTGAGEDALEDVAPDAAVDSALEDTELDSEPADVEEDGSFDAWDAAHDVADEPDTSGDVSDEPDSSSQPDVSPDAPAGTCPAAELGEELGRDSLMIGGAMDDASFGAAPFDIRYHYVAGDVPADGPCDRCDVGCTVRGQSCANDAGCAWWGCWQWDQEPPGRYVANFVHDNAAAGAIPMITYYIWYSIAGDIEGAPEVAELQDGAKVSALLADFRFVCQAMAEEPVVPALLHVEPDLWGYGAQISDDPSTIAVSLSAAGAPECASFGDNFAGLARCMLAIARAEAPNVKVGFHASAWGAGADALINTDPGFDLVGHATETATYMNRLGADQADFVVVEMSDRDAGFNGRWWDDTNATLPNFSQAISWVESLGDRMGLAPLWWQVPYGHVGLSDQCDTYQDNRVAYVFSHPDHFAAAGSLGVAFGAGAGCMTTAETDGGYFVGLATSYFAGQPPPLCGN